jgi:hypothetical protein
LNNNYNNNNNYYFYYFYYFHHNHHHHHHYYYENAKISGLLSGFWKKKMIDFYLSKDRYKFGSAFISNIVIEYSLTFIICYKVKCCLLCKRIKLINFVCTYFIVSVCVKYAEPTYSWNPSLVCIAARHTNL